MSSDIGLQWIDVPRGSAIQLSSQIQPEGARSGKRKRSDDPDNDENSLASLGSFDDTGVELHIEKAPVSAPPFSFGSSVGRAMTAAPVAKASPTEPVVSTADVPAEELSASMKRAATGRYYSLSREATSRCFRCKEVGHYAMFCTVAPKLNPCWICGETGHDCRDCDADACFVCDEAGHRWGVCPNRTTMEREVLRLGHVPGYGRHLVMMLGPEQAALRLMPRRALLDGRANNFKLLRDAMPAAQVLSKQFCLLCAGEGHTSTSCSFASGDLALTQCTRCSKRGHAYCSGPARAPAPGVDGDMAALTTSAKDAGSCFNCGSGSHEGTSCPRARSHVFFEGHIGPQPAEEPQKQRQQHGGYNQGPAHKRSRHEQYGDSDYDEGDAGEEESEVSDEMEQARPRHVQSEPLKSARASGPPTEKAARKCFKCGKEGHELKSCPVRVGGTTSPFVSSLHTGRGGTSHGIGKAALKPGDRHYSGSAPPALAPAPAALPSKAKTWKAMQAPRSSVAGSDGVVVGERDPWYERDPIASTERRRILASNVPEDSKQLMMQKLRKMVKKNEKLAGKGNHL